MAQPHRVVPGHDAKLRPRAEKRSPTVAYLGIAIVGILAIGVAAVPSFRSEPESNAPLSPVTDESAAAWVRIARDLIDVVPARILLGGPGSSSDLDEKLREACLDRELFRRTAIAVRTELAGACDEEEQEALGKSMNDHPLPEGFETHTPPQPSRTNRRWSTPEARELVCELTAKLATEQIPSP